MIELLAGNIPFEPHIQVLIPLLICRVDSLILVNYVRNHVSESVLDSPLKQKHDKFQGYGLGWPGRKSHMCYW
ncbi:hypothetical protein TNCV_1094701 [Trichonephila clavipes]|uniref:Uncharacterized protein n=1 Tax=Trichonephila clavipes TaxID=2585209 RepID=A0A8X6RF70_TRICX|nr:hypothetical protein TNCV_1094701 [Trichonephila clavipes]